MSTAALARRLASAETAAVRRATAARPVPWATPLDLARDCGLALDPWQERVLASSAPRLVMKGPRQVGKSTVAGLLALFTALAAAEALVLLIAPAQDQSKELARTVRRLATALGLATTAHEQLIVPTQLSVARIGFANGSRVLALPGRSEATIRGYPAPALIVADEASRIAEDTFAAIRPMLAASPGGRLVLLSTPFLTQGTFYETWTNGAPGWERVAVATADCPRLSAEYLAQERRELPAWIYAREYEGEFSDDDQSLFAAAVIDQALSDDVRPLFADEAGRPPGVAGHGEGMDGAGPRWATAALAPIPLL